MPYAVEAHNLTISFESSADSLPTLSDISLHISQGDFVSLIGPSGCGKTTLLRIIADLEQPSAGQITVNGVSPRQAREARAYGYVFQAPALYPWRTVGRNVALPLEIMRVPKAERQKRARTYLELVNLPGVEHKFPWQLSGGMQQRAAIARALCINPEILLMDEPFGALDEIVRDHLNVQLRQIWQQTQKTVVFVTHSIPEAVFLSTKIIIMAPRPGRIIDIINCADPADRTLDYRESTEFLKIAAKVRTGLRAAFQDTL